MFRRIISSVILITVLISCFCLSVFAVVPGEESVMAQMKPASYTVSWTTHSETYAELLEYSDVILTGKVISQRTEVRIDLVFTVSEVKVEKVFSGSVSVGSVIPVLQMGGRTGTIYTPAPENGELLEIGEQYILFLKYAPADEKYNAYYLVVGGDQGKFDAENIVPSSINTMASFNYTFSARFREREMRTLASQTNVPEMNTGSWVDGAHLGYVLSGMDDLPNVFVSRVNNAILSWNGLASNCSFTRKFIPMPDVHVYANEYGGVDWAGIVVHYMGNLVEDSAQSGEWNYAVIRLNIAKFSTTSDIWTSIACHEAGHVLGMKDVYNAIVDTVMEIGTTTRYQNGWDSPQPEDIKVLVDRYG